MIPSAINEKKAPIQSIDRNTQSVKHEYNKRSVIECSLTEANNSTPSFPDFIIRREKTATNQHSSHNTNE